MQSMNDIDQVSIKKELSYLEKRLENLDNTRNQLIQRIKILRNSLKTGSNQHLFTQNELQKFPSS